MGTLSLEVVVGTCALLFWLWTLAECVIKEPTGSKDKLVWFNIILFGSVVGALAYYFVRRPKRKAVLHV